MNTRKTGYPEPFPLSARNLCLVGGGTGLAPLIFAAKRAPGAILFAGARTGRELLLLDLLGSRGNILCSTEDGTVGHHGPVTDCLKKRLHDLRGYGFINCGPEAMLAALLDREERADPAFRICLVERYMKCGVGLCGSCSLQGERTCVDGPFFEGAHLRKIRDFGRFRRDASGKKVPISA